MSLREVSAEQFAELFHHYHQSLAPDDDCRNGQVPRAWESIPDEERNRMVAATRLALLELDSEGKEYEHRERYFATPGEAEWGC